MAKRISDEGINGEYPKIRFLGLWDTVASLGVPVPKLTEFRKAFHDEKERLIVAKAVEQVVHLVSIDEDRSLFRPTLVTCEASTTKVNEVWFAGTHGDVGGGWPRKDDKPQLADIALVYMIQQAESCGLGFADGWASKVKVPKEGEGVIHRIELLDPSKILGGINIRSIKGNQTAKPQLHLSVKQKYSSDSAYRPEQLSDLSLFDFVPNTD